ncbi:MAG: hypothetical protein JGK17_15575 [Microcoleus sp. PH2017_10_PVI_O_A]|uniref:hypothetical protein n=1 Tax=unclassified Microcoleus TaxID=2642155 RepID=UPI001D65627F|nr:MULTISPECIES: hypothetical protein [unclassified Microcoleus]TAF00027.1 MAG: hypothetical protein EAZ79_03985 [Oscillatoriales cyanobacterium]MCC3406980.1 hypothetical protein [Microcoleus sp. PH2017_10_PVI_O_A]MCC3461080.1 hypothetical protein [Microcoleus sp. PH2017_11_PCY_U_A]MCC3479597.1 hypothetical protein [Microcoleus sp. PH2017_12_PCY_D_A]MCC3530969.1 hypothetical protein [Microcoleus sp. PH2017_21_RUC_O_A]
MLQSPVSLQTACTSLAVMLSIAVTSSFGRSGAEGVQLNFWVTRVASYVCKQSNLSIHSVAA